MWWRSSLSRYTKRRFYPGTKSINLDALQNGEEPESKITKCGKKESKPVSYDTN